MRVYATRERELELLASFPLVAGMDEVGRGALAGPVTVGVAIVDATVGDSPLGLGDSKILSPAKRVALVEPICQWAVATGVGHASAAEIDQWGIIAALRVAGQRALAKAYASLPSHAPTVPVMILDGKHDWFTAPEPDLLSGLEQSVPRAQEWEDMQRPDPAVVMQVKADLQCSVVAAASVLAKVERDELMAQMADPGYGWSSNKGYASASHIHGLSTLGPSDFHRKSWSLPGVIKE